LNEGEQRERLMARRVVTQEENGRTLEAKAGDEIVIILPERATAGYQWQLAGALPAGVEVLPVTASPARAGAIEGDPRAAIGADAPAAISLRLKESGTHRIRLLEYRPWEGPDKAVNTFELVVSVDRPGASAR
jgi:predicted secreted protein